MIIAVIGNSNKYSMESSLAAAFAAKGHTCKVFDLYDHWLFKNKVTKRYVAPTDLFVRKAFEGFDRKSYIHFANEVDAYNPDLIVCVSRSIHPAFVSFLKKSERRIIHLNPDSIFTLGAQQVFASDYDAWFVKDPYMVSFMRNNMKLNTYLYNEVVDIRQCAKPLESKEIVEKKVGIDVMTYGTLYPYRTRILKHLVNANINLKLFGTTPHRFLDKDVAKTYTGEYLSGAKRAEIIYGSKIVLNTIHFAEIEGVNARFFQINGCGGFQLCDYRAILNNLLPVDPEKVSFKSTDECIEKVRYYLEHPQERYEIANKIYLYSVKRFGFDNLADYLLNKIQKL